MQAEPKPTTPADPAGDLARLEVPPPPTKPWRMLDYPAKGYEGLTRASLTEFRSALQVWQQRCGEIAKENQARAQVAADILIARGFPKSYLREGRGKSRRWSLIEEFTFCFMRTEPLRVDTYTGSEEEWLAAQEREAQAKAKAAETAALRDRAIAWLLAHGQKYGEDFTAETAIDRAAGIAGDEEVERKLAASTWHGFNGQNCDGPCEGWDGKSRRCECGNRRVSWVNGDGHTFETPYVYAEAW